MINDVLIRQGSYFTDRPGERSDRQRRLRPPPPAAARPVDSPADEQPAAGVIHCRHGDQQRVRLPAGRGSITPDPKRFGVFYVKQSFRRGVVRLQGIGEPGAGPAERGRQGQLAGSASPGGADAGALRRLHDNSPGRADVEQVPQPGDQGRAELRRHLALHVPGRGCAGAQRAPQPPWPSSSGWSSARSRRSATPTGRFPGIFSSSGWRSASPGRWWAASPATGSPPA